MSQRMDGVKIFEELKAHDKLDRLLKSPSGVYVNLTATALVASADDTVSLGTASLEFKDLRIDGKAYIDQLGEALDCDGKNITGIADLVLAGASSDISFSSISGGGSVIFTSKLSSDAANRFAMIVTGALEWGDGTGARDTSISRTGADELSMASGDTFTVPDQLKLKLSGGTTATWDPGSIADGDEEAVDVTVTGAALGDYVLASFSLDLLDLVLTASVTATNTVTAVLANNTGGSVDLASGTLKVLVIPAA